MSPKKKSKNINRSTKSLKSQNVKSPGLIKQADAGRSAPTNMRKIMSKKSATPILKDILAHDDISAILKEPGDTVQEVLEEDFFNPPLHSTAVDNDDDDDDDDGILQTKENPDQIQAKLMSPIASVVQEKRMRPRQNTAANMDPSTQRPDTTKPKTSLKNKTQKIPEPGPSKTRGTARTKVIGEPSSTQGPNTTPSGNVSPRKKTQKVPEPGSPKKQGPARTLAIGKPSSAQGLNTTPNRNVSLQKKILKISEPGPSKTHGTARTKVIGEPSSTQGPNASPNRNVVSAKNTKAQRKEETTSRKKKSRKENMAIAAEDTSNPEMMSKSVKSVNALHVVLFECGQFIQSYREEVETDACKRGIDMFSHNFKEQLSTTISELQELKDLKRKNSKMQSEIGIKRKRLIEVKNETIVKQPKLNRLQKECSELEQKHKSLKSAREILDNLTHLQDDYMKFKAENPHVKESYGTCSLPALCLEARNIMKAEQHFHIVNRKLQSVIDQEKGD